MLDDLIDSEPGETDPGQGEPGGAGGEPAQDLGPVPFVQRFTLREQEPQRFSIGEE